MSLRIPLLLLLLLLFPILSRAQNTPPDFCTSFFSDCLLRFEGESSLSTFSLSSTTDNVAFTPAIVIADDEIGILNYNGIIPQFIEDTPSGPVATNVTDFGLTPTQFKPFTINGTGTSGIGHETFQGDGLDAAQGRCVRVYITEGQVLMEEGGPRNAVITPEIAVEIGSCIVFRTA